MGEPTSDRRFKNTCVKAFTSEYKDIKMIMYRDPTFDIDQMQARCTIFIEMVFPASATPRSLIVA